MKYALDSNILSYMLRNDDKVFSRYFETLNNGGRCVIPLIAYYEVKRGLKAANATNKLHQFEKFYKALGTDDLSISDMDIATDIYARNKKTGRHIGDSDTIIAASCIARGYTLVTNNVKHFEHIDGLQLVNWTE
jgi:predicted nucleic acid-binding protein